MKSFFRIITLLIAIINIACLIRFLPHAIRVNSNRFEIIIKESTKDSEDIRNISNKMIMEYPELPDPVKRVLEKFPKLAAERTDSILLFSKSNRSLITLLVFNSSIFMIWLALAFVYSKSAASKSNHPKPPNQ